AITDVNALGQSRPTMWQHDMEAFARRWRAFGWHAIVVDGHDIGALLDALSEARATKGTPTMILARTIKGKGVSFVEGKEAGQGVEEGRRGEPRPGGARSAVRARAGRNGYRGQHCKARRLVAGARGAAAARAARLHAGAGSGDTRSVWRGAGQARRRGYARR